MKKLGLVALLVVLTLIVGPAMVQADPWSALKGSGYAVTVEGFPLEEVSPGDSITAWSGTTDSDVTSVVFNWMGPDGTVIQTSATVSGPTSDTFGYVSEDIYVATSTYVIPTEAWVIGDWGMQAEFWGSGGKLKCTGSAEGIIKIRATSFHAVSEVSIGPLTILLTMLASLAIFARKRF